MWVAPLVLVGVIAVGVAGREGSVAGSSAGLAAGSPAGSAAGPSREPVAAVVAAGGHEASAVTTVGDQAAPAAAPPVAPPAAPPAERPTHRQREEGTDGLMGSLPFRIPGDTPYVRPALVNRFTIDDAVQVPAPLRTTPPWIRRTGDLTSSATGREAG